MKLLLDDLQNLHGACLDADAAGDALGCGALFLQDHDLHGADLDTLAAADALLLVDHVNASLGVLSNSLMLTDLHALAALNTGHGLGSVTLGSDPNAGQIFIKFLIESFGASLYTLQTCHTYFILFNNELLHICNLLMIYFW